MVQSCSSAELAWALQAEGRARPSLLKYKIGFTRQELWSGLSNSTNVIALQLVLHLLC